MFYSKSVTPFLRSYRINFIIKILILSDFLIWSSSNLLAPIFAIFVTNRIVGGSLEVVGIATAIHFGVKAICEIPVGLYIDRSPSEKDDLYTAVVGTLGTAVVLVWYSFISDVSELYLAQAALGLSAAVAYPGWYSIFTRHIDRKEEAFEWSMYDVALGIGMAGSAAIGGIVAELYGFNNLFFAAAGITAFGAILLLIIQKKIYVPRSSKKR